VALIGANADWLSSRWNASISHLPVLEAVATLRIFSNDLLKLFESEVSVCEKAFERALTLTIES
jgi:hypothetical protein